MSNYSINLWSYHLFVLLLLTGDYFLFMFSCATGQVVRMTSDNRFIPLWKLPDLPVADTCAAFSAMGSPAILPLRPETGYQFEVAMFGGGTDTMKNCECTNN